MTPRGKKLLENYVRKTVRRMLKEAELPGGLSQAEYNKIVTNAARSFDKDLQGRGEGVLLVDENRGIYLPKIFGDMVGISLNPKDEYYHDDFDQLISDISDKMKNGYLQQDGDLWAYPNDYERDAQEW